MVLLTPAVRAGLSAAGLLLLLQAMPDLAALLEYRRALLLSEPWRVLSGHLVHVNWTHAFANAAAWVLLARLFERVVDARRQLACMAISALGISGGLAFIYPPIEWYRGASGALHALFFAGATTALVIGWRRFRPLACAAVLLAGGWIKVFLELPGDAATPYAPWLGSTTVPQAHLIGAIIGTGLGVFFGLRSRSAIQLSR